MTNWLKQLENSVRNNSPAILTALGVSGTITTAYLAGKASFEACDKIRAEESMYGPADTYQSMVKERAALVWKGYIPAIASGTATILCIVGASKTGSRRTAAITAAYSISDKAFAEYREKVVEKLGENKERVIRDELAQSHLNNNPPRQDIIISGIGATLTLELYTGRYFSSDMETLRKAQNDINAQLHDQNEATLSDLYHLIGLPDTSESSRLGWDVDRLLNLEYHAILTEDGKPCMAFAYNYVKSL